MDAFTPINVAELVSTGYLRSQKFAEIRFNPLQYNPVSSEIRYFQKIQLQVTLNAAQAKNLGEINSTTQANSIPNSNEGYFEDNLRSTLLNYEQARAWRSQISLPVLAEPTDTSIQPAYKILIDHDGLYKVSYADLYDAGVPTETLDSLDPKTFRLVNQSVEVDILVEGESDSVFDSSDYILFYGQKVNTKYSDINAYWLSWGAEKGNRMDANASTPTGTGDVPTDFQTTQHVEVDTEYFNDMVSGQSKDHWYWGWIDAYYSPAYTDFETEMANLGSGSHTITIRGLMKGYTAVPNHHTLIYLNGQKIADHSFPAGSEYSFDFAVQQSILLEGKNTLRVECPLDNGITLDEILFNWFEIDYYRYLLQRERQALL